MKIKLNKKYRIVSDAHNYILQVKVYPDPNHRLTKDPNKYKWVDVGYYGNFNSLVNALLEKEIKGCDASSFKDIPKLLNDVKKDILTKLEKENQRYSELLNKIRELCDIERPGHVKVNKIKLLLEDEL